MMIGGTGTADKALLDALYAGHHPLLEPAAHVVTLAGEWQVQLGLTFAATLWLLYRRHTRSAFLLLTVVLVGRSLVELQKRGIGRLRPDDETHLVPVKSLSFPSAHAGNSMILFLTAALVLAPERHRPLAVALALLGTFAIGVSRPMLGVHWPSDVVGGWSFGALWVLTMLSLVRRWPRGDEKRKGASGT